MIKQGAILLGITALMLGSCIEHEVIPAPTPTVDLTCHFYGEINGAQVELTQNVLGYYNFASKVQILQPPGNLSSAVYLSQMMSPTVLTSISVGLGSVNWDQATSSGPAVSAFNALFLTNDQPPYSGNGSNGLEVTYRDGTGRNWVSSELSTNFQDAEFTGIVQESDASGDFSKFICNFECYAYSLHPDSLALLPPVVHLDSISILNGVYQGWFER